MSYREVIPDFYNSEEWTTITLNTGGTQSTLQDIKVIEKAGGFCYKDTSDLLCRNRFIYWRAYHDVLELSEISLDFNLINNSVRYKFTDSPVLSVSLIENNHLVVILVITVNSLHRINLPHPNTFLKLEQNDAKCFSIFRDANNTTAQDPRSFYVIGQSVSNNQIPHAASSSLSNDGESAFFCVAYEDNLVLFTMNSQTGQILTNTLKESNFMPRIFSNIKGAIRGKSISQYATSLLFTMIDGQTFMLALYRDNTFKMWSTISFQCLCTISCKDDAETRVQGQRSSMLRKIDDYNVCVYLSHSLGSEFVVIQISGDIGSNFSMLCTKLVSPPQTDLVDFEISHSELWALWCNTNGEFNISSISLISGANHNWATAAMEPLPDRFSISIEQGIDPRQAYCSYIFHPGKFDKNVIYKALVMFRRSNVTFDTNLSISVIKDRVCQVIETEIQNEIKDFDISDEEYIDIATRLWERFYLCCEQYHIKSSQPIGLVLLGKIKGICIIKKSSFSLLRSCEMLEQIMLVSENVENDIITSCDDERINGDVIQLVKLLSLLEIWMSDEMKIGFDKKLYQLEMPDIITSKLVDNILSSKSHEETFPNNFLINLRQNMQSIKDIKYALVLLLDILEINPVFDKGIDLNKNSETMIDNLFGSHIGISFISETVRQVSLIRYSLCRNLLILEQILIDTFALSFDILEIIRSELVPKTAVFTQSYYVMVWISEKPANFYVASSLDNNMQQHKNWLQSTGNLTLNRLMPSVTLLKIFLGSKGLRTALVNLVEGSSKINSQDITLLPIVAVVSELIWPISESFQFGEWLFENRQYLMVQEYVRLLNSWCEVNNCSRQFILAVSLLDSGETNKAYDLFLQSAKGIFTEQFMIENVLQLNHPDIKPNEAIARFYLKVIQLFEQYSALDQIISLAQIAIGLLEKTDSQLPMFQSIVFNNHLTLAHYQEAYHSLIYNAESSRRKDCLRQLIVCLFNEKRLDLLMHFPYIGLHDEFENIIESRARSIGVAENEHYNFLYAFHITKGNLRKAASIMYEQAMRYLLEFNSIEGMQSRLESLLACINILHLTDKKYQWIAKPVVNDDNITANTMDMNEDLYIEDITNEKVIVLTMNDIKKELLQTEALLYFSKCKGDVGLYLNTSAEELSMILANHGLYTSAIKLSLGFGISLLPIFDRLTAACVRAGEKTSNEVWSWLQENDIADLPNKKNAVTTIWLLLEKLINKHEKKDSTLIRQVVVDKLLNLGTFVPFWLHSSYKSENAVELLRLYISHGRLIEATDLAKEMIWAMLGHGFQYFNLKQPLTAKAPATCLPVNSIDLLLYGLDLNSDQIEYKQCRIDLEEIIKYYMETVDRVSDDKVRFAMNEF